MEFYELDSEMWFYCFSYEMKHVLFYGGGSLHFGGSYERDRIGAWQYCLSQLIYLDLKMVRFTVHRRA